MSVNVSVTQFWKGTDRVYLDGWISYIFHVRALHLNEWNIYDHVKIYNRKVCVYIFIYFMFGLSGTNVCNIYCLVNSVIYNITTTGDQSIKSVIPQLWVLNFNEYVYYQTIRIALYFIVMSVKYNSNWVDSALWKQIGFKGEIKF